MRIMFVLLGFILIGSCSGEKKMSETMQEYGYVTKLTHQPEKISVSLRGGGQRVRVDSDGGVSVNNPLDFDPLDFAWADDDIPMVSTHKTPARWGVEFSCEHGEKFTIWRNHDGLYRRFREGDRVIITYKAELKNTGESGKENWVETGDYDFIDAAVYTKK